MCENKNFRPKDKISHKVNCTSNTESLIFIFKARVKYKYIKLRKKILNLNKILNIESSRKDIFYINLLLEFCFFFLFLLEWYKPCGSPEYSVNGLHWGGRECHDQICTSYVKRTLSSLSNSLSLCLSLPPSTYGQFLCTKLTKGWAYSFMPLDMFNDFLREWDVYTGLLGVVKWIQLLTLHACPGLYCFSHLFLGFLLKNTYSTLFVFCTYDRHGNSEEITLFDMILLRQVFKYHWV